MALSNMYVGGFKYFNACVHYIHVAEAIIRSSKCTASKHLKSPTCTYKCMCKCFITGHMTSDLSSAHRGGWT